MNTKHKYAQFLWGFPTTYTQSLTKVGTSSLELPVVPLKVHRTIEFREAETSFLPHYVRQHLEMHVTRKKIQHQWGQPTLMQQSVDRFLPAAPAAAAPHSFRTTCFQVEVKVPSPNPLPFVNLEAKRQLEHHIKSKIIERRWGIPKRVMESLHKVMPFSLSLIRKSRDSQRPSVSLQEKILKKPPSKEVSHLFGKADVEHSKYSALRRHVAKKALEIQMEQVDSVFHLFQATSNQKRKQHSLPRVIPLGRKAQQPRCQELAFVEGEVLLRIEFNIIHKNVTARLGLPTLYRESLSCLFKDVTFRPHPPYPARAPPLTSLPQTPPSLARECGLSLSGM
ncbi:hypothetical protein JRQ81_003215 [Phrynocephalus forsythii]|uniref:SPATA31 domain-containing protein n=1 Tax=Phrynocephalus forsythii TaxID=171643 RepID=A0A9Q1AXE6_9SAUR|nr:hypothetical protein JRQ81_003215 [Phrynocephalus forsythii]